MPDQPPCSPFRPAGPRGSVFPRWLLALTVLAGLLAAVLSPTLFVALGLPELGHWFMDSFVILAAADAVRAGLDPYESIPFDLLGRNHVYSSWWLHLRHFGLSRADNFLFGGAFVVGFFGVAWTALRPRSIGEALYLAAVLLSPPVLLAFNRANNDLVVFTLIGVPLLFLRHVNAPWKIALLAAAMLGATGLKFYPIVALGAIALLDRPGKRALAIAAVAGVAALVVLWLERAGLQRSRFTFPGSLHLFGAQLLLRPAHLGTLASLTLPLAVISAAAGWLAHRKVTHGLNQPDAPSAPARWLFAAGACLLLGCFLAGVSFAYRLIFVIWLCPWLWQLLRDPSVRPIARGTLVLLLLTVWLDGLFCLAINLGFRRLPPFVETLWVYLSQPVHWTLMALLAGWLLEAGIRVVVTLRAATRSPAVSPAPVSG